LIRHGASGLLKAASYLNIYERKKKEKMEFPVNALNSCSVEETHGSHFLSLSEHVKRQFLDVLVYGLALSLSCLLN
jgi:hypothetical protein